MVCEKRVQLAKLVYQVEKHFPSFSGRSPFLEGIFKCLISTSKVTLNGYGFTSVEGDIKALLEVLLQSLIALADLLVKKYPNDLVNKGRLIFLICTSKVTIEGKGYTSLDSDIVVLSKEILQSLIVLAERRVTMNTEDRVNKGRLMILIRTSKLTIKGKGYTNIYGDIAELSKLLL